MTFRGLGYTQKYKRVSTIHIIQIFIECTSMSIKSEQRDSVIQPTRFIMNSVYRVV